MNVIIRTKEDQVLADFNVDNTADEEQIDKILDEIDNNYLIEQLTVVTDPITFDKMDDILNGRADDSEDIVKQFVFLVSQKENNEG